MLHESRTAKMDSPSAWGLAVRLQLFNVKKKSSLLRNVMQRFGYDEAFATTYGKGKVVPVLH
jgi:hypothetical protein